MAPTPIWLDVDTGHDDAFAILLATRHPSAHLLGISTIYGNAPLSKTTHNTLAILTAINRLDVPVYAGALKPFCRPATHAPDIHGESGLDGTTVLPQPTTRARTERSAVEAMYQALSATPRGTAWVVATGALTNAALLFATHPDIVDHLAGVSIMGGAVGGGFTDAPLGMVAGEGERFGNYTPWAEFNVWIDPESAQSILGNEAIAAKTSLMALDLTHSFRATNVVQDALLYGFEGDGSKAPSTTRKLFNEILMFFAKTYTDVFGISDGPPLHDPLAVAAAFAETGIFDDRGGERFKVEVITEGEHGSASVPTNSSSQCGRTVVTPLLPGSGGVRIPRGVQAKSVWRMIDSCLAAVEDDGT